MRYTIANNAGEHQKALIEFIRFTRYDLARALRFEGRQLALLLIKLTPPRNRSQGRAAVARDIRRAVVPLRPGDFDNPNIKALIRRRDYSGLQTVFERFKKGELRNARVAPFAPKQHTSQRDRRGRVTSIKGRASPDATEIRDYIKLVQSRVGRGKGGWAESAIRLGANPANWIAQHRSAGSFFDNADSAVNAYINLINESEWASRGDDDRVVSNALRTRAIAIRLNIKKTIEKAARKAKLK